MPPLSLIYSVRPHSTVNTTRKRINVLNNYYLPILAFPINFYYSAWNETDHIVPFLPKMYWNINRLTVDVPCSLNLMSCRRYTECKTFGKLRVSSDSMSVTINNHTNEVYYIRVGILFFNFECEHSGRCAVVD